MPAPEPEEGFKVTDRRRRESADDPSPVAAVTAPAAPPRPGVEAGPDDEPNLSGLFMMLAGSAVVALGEEPDPATGRRHHDPAQAAEIIDLLLLLQKKTEGNRTAEETQVLEELLYDLQVRYVEVMKRPG